MITGKELKTTTDLVKSVLVKYPEARNSDNYLYLKVVQIIGSKNNINISEMPLSSFLLRMKDLGFPGFESVRRSRRLGRAFRMERCRFRMTPFSQVEG